MSGLDETRPVCDCGGRLVDGLDNKRLIARNIVGVNLMMITSLYEESLTGIRLATYEVSGDENKVITSTFCTNCGNKSSNHDFIFLVKKYIYKYEKNFGTTHGIFSQKLQKKLHGKERRSEPEYEEYLGEDVDEYCPECGNLEDDCSCGNECCDNCGEDRRSCGCYCADCGYLVDDCDC